jgi:hypothetical protein
MDHLHLDSSGLADELTDKVLVQLDKQDQLMMVA